MDSQRNLLVLGLLFVSFLLYTSWIEFNNPQPTPAAQQVQTSTTTNGDVPAANAEINDSTVTTANEQLVVLRNDTLSLQINTRGGDIISSELLQYAKELDSTEPFRLLENTSSHIYVAQSGLIGRDGTDTRQGRPVYAVDATEFALAEGQDSVAAVLRYQAENGLQVEKTYRLDRGSYVVHVDTRLVNQGSNQLAVRPYSQFKQSVKEGSGSLMMPTYKGGVYSSQEENYEKYSWDKIKDRDLKVETQGGWVAMMQHYFVTAWLPNADDQSELYSDYLQNADQVTIGYKTPEIVLAPGENTNLTSRLWIGPKLQDQMAEAAKNLNLTVDYGWLWFIAQPLHMLMLFLQGLVGNWGVAIILTTIVVKTLMYPITKKQYVSMAKMRMLQPKLQALRERVGDDRQRMSQEMMKLYKDEKVNPLGGCLPILLQMPIFIALYWSLMESVEIRHQPFFAWIQDLSVMDPYYILPVLMGASMFFLQKMSPTTITDPMQQKIMQYMPVIFTVFFLWFPAGLVLYWLVSNCITIAQQWYIYRQLEKQGLHSRKGS